MTLQLTDLQFDRLVKALRSYVEELMEFPSPANRERLAECESVGLAIKQALAEQGRKTGDAWINNLREKS